MVCGLRLWRWEVIVVSTSHLSPSSVHGGMVICRAEWLQNCRVGQHGCQLWLRVVLFVSTVSHPRKLGG